MTARRRVFVEHSIIANLLAKTDIERLEIQAHAPTEGVEARVQQLVGKLRETILGAGEQILSLEVFLEPAAVPSQSLVTLIVRTTRPPTLGMIGGLALASVLGIVAGVGFTVYQVNQAIEKVGRTPVIIFTSVVLLLIGVYVFRKERR